MAAPGRPTPQSTPEGPGPKYRDKLPEEFAAPDANPYVRSHREFGPPLLTADAAWTWKGRWHAHFGREAPLHLEIGCGNGFFLRDMALAHPEWDFVGIEIRFKRVVQTAEKLVKAGVRNAAIARYHAAFLDDLFEPGTLSGVYVNHPDPWAKTRHEKNRLISRWFLEDVARLLAPGGWLRVKSDFAPNVDRVVEVLDHDGEGAAAPPLPFRVVGRAVDITRGPAPWPDDVETNYQRKMRLAGKPVAAIEIVRLAS